jgi:hypothetical protein
VSPAPSRSLKWFEHLTRALQRAEAWVLVPALVATAIAVATGPLVAKFGTAAAAGLLAVCGTKLLRLGWNNAPLFYFAIVMARLFFGFDAVASTETFIVDLWVASYIVVKSRQFLLKMRFVLTFTVPWNRSLARSLFQLFALIFHVVRLLFCCCFLPYWLTPLSSL